MTLAPLLALGLLLALAANANNLPVPTRETFNCSLDGSRWPYLIQVPDGDPEATLVYLHGHYSDETQGMTEGTYNDAFGKLRRECLRRKWAYVTAWYGGNTWMGPMGEAGLADLFGVLKERWPGKPIYLCGGSMGGASTLVFAVRRPELVAGAAAFCPAGDMIRYYQFACQSPDATSQNIAAAIRIHYTVDGRALEAELEARSAVKQVERLTMPLYISHGDADAGIPVEGVRALVDKLHALGRKVMYVELAGGGHDAPILQVNWPEALDFIAGK